MRICIVHIPYLHNEESASLDKYMKAAYSFTFSGHVSYSPAVLISDLGVSFTAQ